MTPYEWLRECHRGYSQRAKTVRFLARYPGWHSISDIHREVGFCRLNSRVAEARKVFRRDGHPFDIKHSIRDGVHGYELVPLAETEGQPQKEGSGAVLTPRPDASSVSASGSNLSVQAPSSPGKDGPLSNPPPEPANGDTWITSDGRHFTGLAGLWVEVHAIDPQGQLL